MPYSRSFNFGRGRQTPHILNGQRAITGDTALRLGHFFGTSAEFWLNLQKIYELRVAERKIGADIRNLPRLRDRAA
jgi:plasmid maintenance system antidote protein VapI